MTSADVAFTWKYCTHPEGGCAQNEKYNDVTSVEALDAQTVKVTFSVAKPFPYGPFVGAQAPIIQARQFADCLGAKAPECTDANFGPIGTGPFVVKEFKPNDVISLAANPNYRDAASGDEGKYRRGARACIEPRATHRQKPLAQHLPTRGGCA